MRSKLVPILLNSVPGWVRNAYPNVWQTISLAAHFDTGNYWAQGLGQVSADTLFSCTRASTKYVSNGAGVLLPIATGLLPIADGAGNLVEQAATNLALNSNDLTQATSWTLTNTTALSNQVTGPDGATSGGSLADNSTNGSHNAFASFTAVSGTTYTSSIYLKAGTATIAQLTFASGQFSGTGYANFNLSTGTVSSTGGTLVASGIVAAANGFYRCWIAATATASAVSNASVILTNNNASATRSPSYAGSGQALNPFGAQIEASAFPTSYIPTTTVAVTRAADNIFAASPWLGGNFTMLVKASNIGSTAVFPTLVGLGNAGHTSFFLIYAHNTIVSGKELVSGVTSFDNVISASGISGSATKSVMTLNGTAFRGVSNGAAAASLGTLAAISGLTQFDIGSQGGANSLNGYVTRVAFWNTGMTDAQMQGLTQ